MARFDLFSERERRRAERDEPRLLQYGVVPQPFRVQVIHIWRDALGTDPMPGPMQSPDGWTRKSPAWRVIHDIGAREKGLLHLGQAEQSPGKQCEGFLLRAADMDALDIIEASFAVIERVMPTEMGEFSRAARPSLDAAEAIQELNHRFQQHALGYRFIEGKLVRVDSEFLHAEVVEPTLVLLHVRGFQGPSEEFLRAHEHHRHGRHKEAMSEALKAVESTLKAICDERGWTRDPNATVKPLINVVLANELVPKSLQNQFSQLAELLLAVATPRNKMSGHGQGSRPVAVPAYLAAYALHQAAATIVLLVEAHKAKS